MNRKLLLSFIFVILLTCGNASSDEKIKYPNVSGQFYPSTKESLSSQIDDFFDKVKLDPALSDREILGIISPHAGYVYSGQVAAYGFKAIQGKNYDTVIVLAPSHNSHYYNLGGVFVYKEGFFRTPLGDIQVDSELANKLISSYDKIAYTPQAFETEHSLEVELPFLQKSLDNFKIVPMVFGQLDYSDYTKVAKAIIDATKDKRVLVVASTDLSHYHPYLEAVEKDSKTISYIKNVDAFGLWQSDLKGESEACGVIPVLVLLNYAKELGLKSQVLNYANSGDVTGDKSGVVGYMSAVFYKDSNGSVVKGEEEMLSESQKKRLLEIARQSMSDYISTGKRTSFQENDPALNAKNGAFVTLHNDGRLRGCIGSFISNEPLYKVIADMAIESATKDFRFSSDPVTIKEMKSIKIEISVLTEPKLIDDWRKIRLGIDGVIVRKGFASGVFLPQVATETGWSLETFLSELCRQKAGLSADAYKDPSTQLYTFQAYVFSEE